MEIYDTGNDISIGFLLGGGGSYEFSHFISQWMVHFKSDENFPKRHLLGKHTLPLTQCMSRLQDDVRVTGVGKFPPPL